MTRPSVGQLPSYNNRAPVKSNLDPASGAFKYPYGGSMAFGDNKENGPTQPNKAGFADQHYGLSDRRLGAAYKTSQADSRAGSFASSRYTDAEGPVNSIFNDNASTFNHSPQNSFHAQRLSGTSRNQSFGSGNGRMFAASQRSYGTESQFAGSFGDFNLRGGVLDTPLGSSDVSPSQYSTGANRDSVLVSASVVSRIGDREHIGQFNAVRNHNSGFGYNSVSSNDSDMSTALVRNQQAHGYSDLDRSLQRLTLQQQQQQAFYGSQHIFGNQFQGQYPPEAWDYPYQSTRPLQQNYSHYQNSVHNFGVMNAPRGPSRDQDLGHGVRSLLLEEFRNNTKSNSRRYDLKDIYNYVVEFSGDQHGSRFIQQKLETANSDEKDQIFREIQPNALQLMTDVFGNYVIQKLFEHGNQIQKKILAEIMKGRVNELSLQMYGCRVVQKVLEHVLADQQAALVKELQVDVLRCVKDQNGNHVIQKAIERCPKEHVQFILDAFRGQVHTLATHPYGCRVIQRMLEYCSPQDQASILDELFACAQMLITDQYGNYVVQHVIQHGKPEHRAALIKLVTAQLHALSKHKFASNVVERSFVCGREEERETMVRLITEPNADGSSPLHLMMKDQYGNYVIRKQQILQHHNLITNALTEKILIQLKGAERERFVEHVKPHLATLRKFNAGKQLAAIEKLIFIAPLGPHRQTSTTSPLGLHHHTAPALNVTFGDINVSSNVSTTPTPMLTMEQNSPQSSGMPSTTPSLIDGANELLQTGTKNDGTPTPEVRIETV